MLDCVVSAAPIMIIIGASLSEPHLLCPGEVLSIHIVKKTLTLDIIIVWFLYRYVN